jgi:hypothetical protein
MIQAARAGSMAKRIGYIRAVGFLVDRFQERMRVAHP